MKTLIGCLAALYAAYHLSTSTLDRSNLTRANLHHANEPIGSIEVRGRNGSWSPLAPGSAGQVLMMVGGVPTWVSLTSAMLPSHASRHQPGGGDPMAVNAAAGTGSLRSLGTGSTNAAAGNHTHP